MTKGFGRAFQEKVPKGIEPIRTWQQARPSTLTNYGSVRSAAACGSLSEVCTAAVAWSTAPTRGMCMLRWISLSSSPNCGRAETTQMTFLRASPSS